MSRAMLLLTIGLISLMNFFACDKDEDRCVNYEWGYEGEDGPEHWTACFVDCGGMSQSPLNITGTMADATLEALEPHYEEVPIDVLHKGHTLEFEYETGSTLVLNGLVYNLLQFHFHTESEHTIAGSHYPMEVHLVHKHEPSGQLAVIGVFFENGVENSFLKNFSDHLPETKDQRYTSVTTVNVHNLLPTDPGYYTYSGSLTTPPCSEIVSWLVMKTPVEASSAQLQKFHEIMHDNNRPVQELNGRIVREY